MTMSTISESKTLSSAAVREKHKEFLFPSVTNYYEESVVLESGKGMHVRRTPTGESTSTSSAAS